MINTFANFISRKFRIDAHYFLKGGFWLSVGQMMTLAFGLLTTVLFAHYLSENQFGIYKYLLGLAALLSTFSLSGLGQSILQTAAKGYLGFYKETLGIGLKYSAYITVAALLLSTYYWTKDNFTLSLGCLLIAVVQPLISVYQFTPSYLQGTHRFKESTILHTIRMVVVTVASLIALFITKNVLVLLATYLVTQVLTNFLSHRYYCYNEEVTPEPIRQRFITYAKHTSVRGILSSVAQKLDSVIIFTQLGAVELAIYSIAIVIPEQIKGSVKNLASLLLPKYSNSTNIAGHKKAIARRSLQLLVIFSVLSLLYIAIAPIVISYLFPKYQEAIFFSQILALSFPAMVAILPVSILQSQLQERALYNILLLESVTSVSLTVFLTINFGLIGAVVAKVLTRYVTLGYDLYFLYKVKALE